MNHPDDGDEYVPLPSRRRDVSRSIRLEARPELRDRAEYYTALRYAVHCQSRSGLPDLGAPNSPDTWTY
jgi:hypothetical protein